MFPVFFLLLPLYSIFQLLKSTSHNQNTVSGSRNDDEYSEEVVNSETSSSSSSSSSTDEYDVFLSFRGPDTRQGFTDVLYDTMIRAGIRVFRDADEVYVGQRLQKILHAIETSQICVPIFSQTFAASSWCLREVATMIELKKDVMPIFYDVKPDDLKLQTGAYSSHLKSHEKKKGTEQVKVWKDTLKKVAEIKGKEVLNTRYTEFCKQFVDEVLSTLKPKKRLYTGYLVGVGSKIESVMKLMDVQSHDIRYIGIHGMGGLGKTTLAKAIFGDLRANFDCSCFLRDVRESALRDSTLQDLQKQLQQGLDPEFARGCNSLRDIEGRFQKRRVLVVLDDVDKWEQIEKLAGHSSWFGSGSRIIITTRNIGVLTKNGGGLDQNDVLSFEISPLNNDQAFELFQWHAFRKEKPPPPSSLETISREIVQRAGGVPLALKVVGSRLYNCKNEAVWRDVLKRLRKAPLGEVKEALKISYDALEHEEKQIFLDIACVGAMVEKQKAVYYWDASAFFPNLSLEVLCSMSLVKVVDDDKLWMHDLLKDLGKDIVREESVKEPGKRSRVWENEEATEVLHSKEGKEMVEVLCISKPLEVCLTHENLAPFRELRFLQLVGTYIECDFRNLLPKLAWFKWHLCPPILNNTNLYMKNLVVLDLSFSFISENWGGWSLIQMLNNLKVLALSNCHNLTRTPDFSEINRLERLELRHCSNLREIHGSIGKLRRLKHLDLRNCYSLDGLPDEIGCLINLEKLQVRGSRRANGTFNLPSTIGHLESLLVLQLEHVDIVDIPGSIGRLAKLRELCLKDCWTIKELPESLGNMESLRMLVLKSCRGITELPKSIGGLAKLESLNLCGCSSLEILPESFGQLQELKKLDLSLCKLRKLPVFIGFLKKLQRIDYYCGSNNDHVLKQVPMEIGSLSCMRQLILYESSITMLPSTISQLKLLEELDLRKNHQLQELPDLPLSLIKLRVSSKSLHKFPDLSRLVNLIELMFLDIDDYRWPQPQQQSSSKFKGIEKLTKLKILTMGFASATALQFDMDSLTWLEKLSLEGPYSLPPAGSSSSLELVDMCIARVDLELPDLFSLKKFSTLKSNGGGCCCITERHKSAAFGVRHFRKYVNSLTISNRGIELIEKGYSFKNLRSLYIWDCASFKTLPDISKMRNLNRLGVHNCKGVVEISGLRNLISLDSLDISRCGSLEHISKLVKLTYLRIFYCPNLRTIDQGITNEKKLMLSTLLINDCKSLQKVDELKKKSKRGSINGLPFENFR